MFFEYLKLECKRVLRLFPKIFLATIFVGVVVGSIVLINIRRESEGISSINVGVVAKESDMRFIDLGIYLVEYTDDLKYICNFSKVSEDEGTKKLENGTFDALLIFPENYVRSVYNGNEKPLVLKFGTAQADISSLLFHRLSDVIANYMMEAKAGVYGLQDMYEEWNYMYKYDADELAERYAMKIFARKNMIVEELVLPTKNMSVVHYYASAVLILVFLFWGLNCGSVFGNDEDVLKKLLRRRGLSFQKQMLVKLLSLFLLFIMNFTFLVVIFRVVQHILPNSFLYIDSIVFIKILPAILLICSFILIVYELFDGGIGGMLFIFFSSVIMGFISGFFYPSSYFPEWVQYLGKFLPTGVLFDYVSACIGRYNIFFPLIKILIYMFVFLTILLFGIHIRLAGSVSVRLKAIYKKGY